MLRALAVAGLLCLTSCNCGGTPPAVQDGGVLTCATSLTACAGSCVDLTTNDHNCSACGSDCGVDMACAGSRCYPTVCNGDPCAPGQVCLSGFCVDKSCFGVVCPMGEVCAAGQCLPSACGAQSCPVGDVCVANACVEGDCVGVLCPSGSVCVRGSCVFMTCGNMMIDGDETDVDCGGKSCPACLPGKRCAVAGDCTSALCTMGFCAAPTCSDGVRNGGEGDVDCGGNCPPCVDGRTCALASQCASGVCAMGVCAAPSCTDGVTNGPETDVDCGGGCPGCGDGEKCGNGGDCASARCASNKCVPSQCLDGTKDGTETDVDCGGACVGCMPGQSCDGGTDCLSGFCNTTHKCDPPSCTDMVLNGTESDIDCGGTCPKCPVGDECVTGADCLSVSCSPMHRCVAASCTDLIKNENESDVDCGGPTACPRCGFNKACAAPSDCASNQCVGGRCTVAPIFGPTWDSYTDSSPYDLAVTDFDNDGNLDLIVTDDQNYDLTLYWGNGDGTFTQAPGPAVSGIVMTTQITGPRGIAIGDFNGDHTPDLLIGRAYEPFGNPDWCVFTLIPGAGGRLFSTPQDYAVTTNNTSGCGEQARAFSPDAGLPTSVLLTADRPEPGNGFLWAATPGTPSAPLTIPGIGSTAAVADLNGDGRLDIVSHLAHLSSVNIILGLPDGGFSAPTTIPVAPGFGQVAIGHIDNDSTLDIAVACDSSATISIALGKGDGTFLAAIGVGAGGGSTVSLADFDGDGNTDMISSGGVVHFHRGKGNGQFFPMENYGPGSISGSWKVAVGDFNKDGKPDAVMLYRTAAGSNATVLKNISP